MLYSAVYLISCFLVFVTVKVKLNFSNKEETSVAPKDILVCSVLIVITSLILCIITVVQNKETDIIQSYIFNILKISCMAGIAILHNDFQEQRKQRKNNKAECKKNQYFDKVKTLIRTVRIEK